MNLHPGAELGTTRYGRILQGRVDEPKADLGNPLDRDELTAKALQLGAFSDNPTAQELQTPVQRLWRVAEWPRVGALLA